MSRITIECTMTPASNRPADRLVRTKTGLLIGSAYIPPQPVPSKDADRIQSALLGKRSAIDWDGILIAAFGIAVLLCFVYRGLA